MILVEFFGRLHSLGVSGKFSGTSDPIFTESRLSSEGGG